MKIVEGVNVRLGFELARALRSEVRDFMFGELIKGGVLIGIYILTPDAELSPELRATIKALVRAHQPLRSEVRFFSVESNG